MARLSILRKLTLLQLFNLVLLFGLSLLYPGKFFSTRLPTPKVLSANIDLQPVELPISSREVASLSAQAALVYDPDSGTILYQKNLNQKLHPASTTKIMTALVALDHYQPDDIITVKTADQAIGNTMHLIAGDQLYARDLLYGLLVASANDAAVAFAENFTDGYLGFVAAMNQKATQLHLRDTHYTNVSGIEGENHKTTVLDLAILAREAMKDPTFAQVVGTVSAQVTDLSGTHSYPLHTTNQLLGHVKGLKGIKTGWTELAGECLVSYVERDNHRIITVVLNSVDRFGESKQLINWAYSHTWVTIN